MGFLSTFVSPSGGVTIATQEALVTSDDTTTSTSYEIVTGLQVTLPTNSGKSQIIATMVIMQSTNQQGIYIVLHDDGSTLSGDTANVSLASLQIPATITAVNDNDGSVIAVFFKVSANTGTIITNPPEAKILSFEIS